MADHLHLTPLQRVLLHFHSSEPDHFNVGRLFEVAHLEPSLVRRVAEHLLSHHEALRLRIVLGRRGWEQIARSREDAVFEYKPVLFTGKLEETAVLGCLPSVV